MSMYFNTKDKKEYTRYEIKAALHCSFPKNAESVGNYHLIHDEEYPEDFNDQTQNAVRGEVVKNGDIYVRPWIISDKSKEEITALRLQTQKESCQSLLDQTDYLFIADYDGPGSDNAKFIEAVKEARHIWRQGRQVDELLKVDIPSKPVLADYQ